MAQKVNIILVDDIDGTEATETVTFALDGTTYEIDLNETNAQSLRTSLSGFVTHARKVSSGRKAAGRRSAQPAAGASSNTKDVREWAKAQGMEVSERGRISADVQQAYDAAH